jgi:hypothetical protein
MKKILVTETQLKKLEKFIKKSHRKPLAEALQLRRIQEKNTLVVISDLEDKKAASQETFRNKKKK